MTRSATPISVPDNRPIIRIAGLTVGPPDTEKTLSTDPSFSNALQWIRPFARLALQELTNSYGHIFRFYHSYLYDADRALGYLLPDDAENLVAEFFFKYNETTHGLAIISPCEYYRFYLF
ncbi:hypothetical protein BV898_05359 [Hypsibius exemplaris]|uniref:Uncharacterized protein n=1 Tax=Hypsibius exemplaris TaxID=2072580 RepID=A0A1W0X0E1_HYPEX|nr:hypothetical protein BV898_05359 [Hypsibius exemplaris]